MLIKLHSRYAYLVSLCLLLILPACRAERTGLSEETNYDDVAEIKLTTLVKGSFSAVDEEKYVVVDSQKAWKELWERIHEDTTPLPPLPGADFDSETVLAAFMGTRPTGGYGIEIDHINKHKERLRAIVKTSTPGPGEMVSMAITRPYHIVRICTTVREVDFIKK